MSSEEIIDTLKEEVSENLEGAPSVESIPIEFVSGSQKLKKTDKHQCKHRRKVSKR